MGLFRNLLEDRGRLGGRLHRALCGRRLPITLGALAILVALPSLWAGWVMDDHFHRMKLTHADRLPEVFDDSWDMFRFMDGDVEHTVRMMDFGTLPWWTYPKIVAQFWRPITTLTHRVDYQLWPKSPLLMHAQSLLWFGALVCAVTVLYRRLMGWTLIAGLAALFYAIDDAHAAPAGWIANRNAVVAAFFGVVALIFHDKWRRDGWRPGIILGPLMLTVSLFAKEAGVAVAGYLFAYAVCLDRTSWRNRFASLAPYFVVIATWRVLWVMKGNGLHGIGLYVDPLTEPLRFMAAFLIRAPILLVGQLAVPSADLSVILDEPGVRMLAICTSVVLTVLLFVLAPLARENRVGRFFALGMLLSVVPACVTFPSDRLLSYVGLGAMGLISMFLCRMFGADARPQTSRRLTVLVGWLFIGCHFYLAPVALLIRSSAPCGPRSLHDKLHVHTPMDASVEDQDVVIVNAPSVFHVIYLPVLRALDGMPVPRHTRSLAPGIYGVTVLRPDERTLVVRPNASYLHWMFHRLFRNDRHPFAVGDRVELTGMTVEITALSDLGRPAEAAFHFDVPLEDPSLRWLYYEGTEFLPFHPPAIGETVELPPQFGLKPPNTD